MVLAVVKKFADDNPNITYSEIKEFFPDDMQGTRYGVIQTYEYAQSIYEDTGTARHFIKPDEIIRLKDQKIAVSTQWGINRKDEFNSNINKFIRKATELGYKIEQY